MKARVRGVIGIALAAFAVAAEAQAAVAKPRSPGRSGSTPALQGDAALEALARDTFQRLLRLSPIPGPEPVLVISDDPTPKAKALKATVTITRKLLRLCAAVGPRPARPSNDARDALIAFVLAHELAHLARRDAGSFGSREASEAVEKDADEQAVRRLFMAGIDLQPLRVGHLLRAIARESGQPTSSWSGSGRARGVEKALADAQRSARESHFGWLLTAAGRFDQAIAFYENVASTYPYPEPMYVLAVTRLQAAWRRAPCDDPTLLEWLPPLRYDPRSQVEPLKVRSSDDPCRPLRVALATAAGELAQAPDHVPAQIALASIRLMQRDPTLDPTRAIGGVARVGDECPPSSDSSRALLEADACHVSLLSQYELSRRSPEARQAAIAGLRRLSERWPAEPSLSFNLARLLMAANRQAEAVPLWRSFLEGASAGPYRDEAEVSLSRVPHEALAPALPRSPRSPIDVPAGSASRLIPPPEKCLLSRHWRVLPLSSSSSWRYCGDWSDEIVVANARETLIRSIAVGSKAWPGTEPPLTRPLFITTSATGEELRVWEEEAWAFDAKTPRRVVYFTKPQ